jgi:hypothetical protein
MNKLIKILSFTLFITVVNCGEDDTIGSVEFGVITGKVVKASDFEPIENVKITLSPTNNTTFTDANGEFIFEETPTNEYSLEASKEDLLTKFEPTSVVAGATVNVVFEMEISTALNKPPTKPELLTPADATENLNNSVELKWNSTDVDNDLLKYRLEIKNDFNNNIIKVEDLTDTIYTVSDLKFGAKYFWQIAVSDDINSEVLSAVSAFTITSNPNNRFLYVKKENSNTVIYSANINSNNNLINELRLTEVNTNSWRPRKSNTANLIAFLRTDNNESHIYTMNTDGSEVTKVTSNIPITGFNFNEIDFAWSANGNRLIYPNFDKLYMINKDGSGLQQIYQTTDGSYITEVDWSNDTTKIALKTNDINGYNVKIFTIDLNGNILETVLAGLQGAAGGINFSIDAKLLLYTRDISNFESLNYRQLDSHIFLYNFVTMIVTDVSSQKVDGTNDLDARFSPNEAEVIFVNTSNDGLSEKTIYKTLTSGAGLKSTLFLNAMMPDWE